MLSRAILPSRSCSYEMRTRQLLPEFAAPMSGVAHRVPRPASGDWLCGLAADSVGCTGSGGIRCHSLQWREGSSLPYGLRWAFLFVLPRANALTTNSQRYRIRICGRNCLPAHVEGNAASVTQRVWADDVASCWRPGSTATMFTLKTYATSRAQRNRLHPAVGEPHIRPGSPAQRRPGAFLLDGPHCPHPGVVRFRWWRTCGVLWKYARSATSPSLGDRRILPVSSSKSWLPPMSVTLRVRAAMRGGLLLSIGCR